MSKLSRIFSPIVEESKVPLSEIDVVAFDIGGTLVHTKPDYTGYIPDKETVRLLEDIASLKDAEIDEVVIMTDDLSGAGPRLQGASLQRLLLIQPQDRNQFYDRMEQEGKKVLAIDNDFFAAMRADAHVNPATRAFKDYVGSRNTSGPLKL